MKELFNADAYGLTKGTTDRIIHAHLNGVVQSTTLMMNGLAVDYAIRRAKQTTTSKVGIHLVLAWGKPVSHSVPGLVDRNGYFKYQNTFTELDPPHPSDVEKECRAQIEAFLKPA